MSIDIEEVIHNIKNIKRLLLRSGAEGSTTPDLNNAIKAIEQQQKEIKDLKEEIEILSDTNDPCGD